MTVADVALSPDQQQAHDHVVEWQRARTSLLKTLGGWAGTGKTTTLGAIVNTLRARQDRLRVAFCCFTGKASLVMRNKLEASRALREGEGQDYCGTIHSLIYEPVVRDGYVVGWRRVATLPFDLIVLDEASMVDALLFKDLQSYGLPILAVGDHGQLPPVSGELNLMSNPEIRLEKIHRQAEDNPIVHVSRVVREEGYLPPGRYGEWVNKVTDPEVLERVRDLKDVLVICGTNKTRARLNSFLRARADFDGPLPMKGEKVICLRNNRAAGIYNGMTGTLLEPPRPNDLWLRLSVKMDGGPVFKGDAFAAQFGAPKTLDEFDRGPNKTKLKGPQLGDLFDWGYAMTCHKAQGSEAKRVVVFEECEWMRDEDLQRRWAYTAYTRARERLLIIGRER